MPVTPEAANMSTEHLFRASKKRKIVRRPNVVASDQAQTAGSLGASSQDAEPDTRSTAVESYARTHVTAAGLAHRRRLANRRGGVKFAAQRSDSSTAAQIKTQREGGTTLELATEVIANRFAPQMGQASAVADKHM